MEGDEIQMGREELQKWVRRKVRKNKLMISDVLEKCNLLQSLLEKREKQAAQLLRLCRSVSACEATVKKQYSLLGWKYRDTDSDDDDNITGCGNTVPSPPTTNGPTPLIPKLQYSENLHRDNSKRVSLKRKPVVVLTRLSSRKIRSLRPPTPPMPSNPLNPLNPLNPPNPPNPLNPLNPLNPPTPPTPPNPDSEDESSNSGSDVQWEPQDDSSDSDYSLSSNNSGSNKRRKIDQQNQKPVSHTTTQASTSTDAQSNVTEASTPPAGTNGNAKSNLTQTSTLPGSANPTAKINVTKAPTLSASTNGNAMSNVTKTSTPPANTNAVYPVFVTTLCQTPVEARTKTPPSVLHEEPKVDMTVLARQRAMNWQQGKITEIITKGTRLKYKIHSEERGKSLVSGHHIAFDRMPKVEQLFVGARVLMKCQTDQYQFCAGILGELPSRKNRMRFLVFSDDHTPAYVGLPLLRLVCRPLTDPLDDVPDGFHRDFLKEYLKAWPYPPQTQYKVGQGINAEFEGVMQKCDVKTIVGSLIQVVVSTDKREEWIYRGSPCLQNMIRLRESNKKKGQNNKSPKVNESSKSAH